MNKAEKGLIGEQSSVEFGGEQNELSPDELREYLSQIKTQYCTELGDGLDVKVIFPEGTMMGGVDLSNQSLEDTLNMLIDPLESYEPPITQEQVEQESEDVSTWLHGHEELIWEGAYENPIWQVNDRQYDRKVIVSYERRGQELKPGKSKFEQKQELEGVDNIFTLDEWRIAKQVFAEYAQLESDIQGDDPEAKKEAKKIIRKVIKEENAFRNGKGEYPKILSGKINEMAESVAKSTRGFKIENIDLDGLIQKTADILSQLVVLNYTRGEGRERVPKIKPDIKEIPSFEYSLSLLAGCLDNQLKSGTGLVSMTGEAGVGKNEAVEYLAAKTKRPFYWFPCSRGMEATDLVTHYEFDTKEGTQRFLTDLAEGIQMPGAIVMVDEVNALKLGVQMVFHGLGDSNRSLNYDGVKIPVAEGTLIVIAGNPATYGSAGDLGQALLGRTMGQSMVMDYPSLKKGGLLQRKERWSDSILEQKEQEDNELRDYACDEVRVLYSLLSEFSDLNDEEFELMWDVVINESTQGVRINEIENNVKLETLLKGATGETTRKTLMDLRDILRITDTWRQYYEKRAGGLDIIGVSMRGTIAVVKEYAGERDVKKAYLKIIDNFRKNPIEGLDNTFKTLEQLIDDTLGVAV